VAPVLTGGYNFTSITEDQTSTGQFGVFLIAGQSTTRTPPAGIAVTSQDNGNGSWQFSTDGGQNWSALDTTTGAILLGAGTQERIRFVPDGMTHHRQCHLFRLGPDRRHSSGDTGVTIAAMAAPAPIVCSPSHRTSR